jgi:hypothetical protein
MYAELPKTSAPETFQAEPFHRATLLKAIPPAVVKFPLTEMSVPDPRTVSRLSAAMAIGDLIVGKLVGICVQLESFHSAMYPKLAPANPFELERSYSSPS